MRYALIFAGVAAAYDAYGYEAYGEHKASSSSTPAVKYSSSVPAHGDYKTSSAPAPSKASSTAKLGYTTIYPGYGKEPVTVTSQYQPYPTCGAAGSDGKSCDKWNEDKYVSTVINDYNSKKVTVTYVEKPITVYQTKTTVTHYPTASSAAGKDGKAYPTGSYGHDDKKNGTQAWYELYEKIHEIKYKDLGAHGLPGYGGSGLCKSCDDEQPYKVKEYKDGKWSEYDTTAVYKVPTPETKTYEKPGVYTEPAKDVTVTYTVTKPAEATTTAKSGVPVTYGGVTTEFKETGVKTCAYGAYETGKGKDGKDVTSTVVKTVTVTVSTTGKYEVAKPTVTVYDKDTKVTYPTVSVYQPGVYHKDAQTVTITKSGEAATCEYKQTKTYPAEPKKTPTHGEEYPHGDKSSSKPVVETKTKSEEYPSYPTSSVPSHGEEYPPYGGKSSSKPNVETKTSTEYKPDYPTSTPCTTSSKPSIETKTKSEEYPSYPTSSVPSHGEEYPPYGGKSSSKPNVETKTSTEYKPDYPTSTPCTTSSKPSVETKTIEYPSYPTASVPSHGEEYPPYGAESSSKPSVETKTSSAPYYPEYPAASSSAPAYYPEPSTSAPVYEAYPVATPTPAKYEDNKFSYGPAPSKATAAYPEASSAYPEGNKDNSYDAGKGYGYSKRANAVERRKAVVAKRGN